MNLWDLKDALLANRIEDEELYAVDELDGVKIPGRRLKCPGFVQYTESHIHWRMNNPAEVARFYPNMYHWMVQQIAPESPAYEINSKFKGVREAVKELQLPYGDDVFYRSRIFTDTSFRAAAGLAPAAPGQYTIEVFGVTVVPHPPHAAEYFDLLIPGSSTWLCSPMQLKEADSCITVVWRLRIFSCPVEHFEFSPANPLAPSDPKVLHFEHRWHPQKGVEEGFKNVEQVRTSAPALFDRFKSDTFALLKKQPRRGRPPHSGEFTSPREFEELYEEVLNRYGGVEPPIKQLVKECKIATSTFYRYVEDFGVKRRKREN